MKTFKAFITEHFEDSIMDYMNVEGKDTHAHVINKALRTGKKLKPRQQTVVDDLDHEIKHSEPTHHTTLYRGMSNKLGLKVGDVHHEKGFASTTSDLKTAQDYTHPEHGELHHITIPHGTKTLDTEPHDEFYGGAEKEHILPRGSKFRVDGHSRDSDGRHVVHMTHMGDET
jgi:hypothetical protein